MSSFGGVLLCSAHHPFPLLTPQQHCPSSAYFSWSFSTIQKQLGHNVMPSYGSRQCGGSGQTKVFAYGAGYKLEVRELSKQAPNNDVILDKVSFEIKAGAVHGLVGPSGCGKTTVLRALNRLWEPSEGTVFYEGVDVTTMDIIALRLRVGMVFQAAALFKGTVV